MGYIRNPRRIHRDITYHLRKRYPEFFEDKESQVYGFYELLSDIPDEGGSSGDD